MPYGRKDLRYMKTKRQLSAISMILVGVIVIGLGVTAMAAGTIPKEEITSLVDTATDASLVTSPIIEAANQAKQSVVGVNNYQTSQSNVFGYGWGYYQVPGESVERLHATGSGVVVSPYGHILTNNHVVENAARVMVTYEDKEIAAQIVAQDAALDIAILLAPGIELPAAPLGDSDSLQVGEYAIVIGNPLGQEFERTVTVGYVSAIDREVRDRVSDRYGRSATVKNQMIQVDAAINEGNSGGGMFNTLGQLQGVPARKYDAGGNSIFGLQQQASVDNIGMCIPINVAKPMLKTVLESYDENAIQTAQAQTPAAPRPMIGVTVRTLTAGEAQKLDGTLPNGAYVVKVEPNSPAQAAGIKKGDIIVEADGEVLAHSTHLIEVLAQHKEGDTVKLKIFRAEGTDDVASLNTIGESEYVDLEVMLQLLEDVTM